MSYSYQKEVVGLYGREFVETLLNYVDTDNITERMATVMAFELGDSIGGRFVQNMKEKSIGYDRISFKGILTDYYSSFAPTNGHEERAKIIGILQNPDLRLNHLAKTLEKLNIDNPTAAEPTKSASIGEKHF